MESVACALCGQNEPTVRMTQKDINLGRGEQLFSIVQCGSCGLLYLNPRPSQAEIHAYYPSAYYPLEESNPRRAIDGFFKRLSNLQKKVIREEFYGYPGPARPWWLRFIRRVLTIPEHLHLKVVGRAPLPYIGEGRILDVGSGPGKLLKKLRDEGWDTYGVDFSPVAVDYARQKHNLNVVLGELSTAGFKDNFFDVVMFNHCLEHIFQPVETLREVHRILKPGGMLMICIPNAAGVEAHLFGKWWIQWDVPRHLFHFTKVTMGQLLRQTGFHMKKIEDGVGKSFFLGSVDVIYKYVLKREMKHGAIMRHLATPLCLLFGLIGKGSEMKVFAEKSSSV